MFHPRPSGSLSHMFSKGSNSSASLTTREQGYGDIMNKSYSYESRNSVVDAFASIKLGHVSDDSCLLTSDHSKSSMTDLSSRYQCTSSLDLSSVKLGPSKETVELAKKGIFEKNYLIQLLFSLERLHGGKIQSSLETLKFHFVIDTTNHADAAGEYKERYHHTGGGVISVTGANQQQQRMVLYDSNNNNIIGASSPYSTGAFVSKNGIVPQVSAGISTTNVPSANSTMGHRKNLFLSSHPNVSRNNRGSFGNSASVSIDRHIQQNTANDASLSDATVDTRRREYNQPGSQTATTKGFIGGINNWRTPILASKLKSMPQVDEGSKFDMFRGIRFKNPPTTNNEISNRIVEPISNVLKSVDASKMNVRVPKSVFSPKNSNNAMMNIANKNGLTASANSFDHILQSKSCEASLISSRISNAAAVSTTNDWLSKGMESSILDSWKAESVDNSSITTVPEKQTSLLERLVEKSFDSSDKISVDIESLKSKAIAKNTTPSPVTLAWQYMDPHGLIHGPFSSQQMYSWYKKNFFPPTLSMRCNPATPWMPLKDLYPSGTVPFRDMPIIRRSLVTAVTNTTSSGSSLMNKQSLKKPLLQQGESLVQDIIQMPSIHDIMTQSGTTATATLPPNRRVMAQRNVKELHNWNSNKIKDMQMDSLFHMMDPQKNTGNQSIPTEATSVVVNKSSSLSARTSNATGWNVVEETDSPQIVSEDFPTLGSVDAIKQKSKIIGSKGTTSKNATTMPLKVFMEKHKQPSESFSPDRVHPDQTFASKLMGGNKSN